MADAAQKTALVTGASRGIGRAIAVRLGSLGYRVFVNYRAGSDDAAEVVAQVTAAGGQAEAMQADIGDVQSATQLAGAVLERVGRVDVLVNNAGIQRSAMLHKMSDADWREVMAVNLDAVFYLSRALLPSMRELGSGHIVNIASASSFVAQAGCASYVASKHALIGLTKAMALENAKKGVLVNAVAPGLTETDMVHGLSDAQRAGLMKMVPLGRLAEPDEIAEAVEWLVTRARYTTGNVINVSGGVVMG